jgi:polyhydroxybutyrate depolymerase
MSVTSVSLVHDGLARPYALHLPAAPDGPMPLLVELHGRGIPPHLFDRWTGFGAMVESAGFALALPAAVDERWNDGRFPGTRWERVDDVGYLAAVIEDACGRAALDERRVSMVGMSNGAVMAGRFAWEQPGRLSGFAQVAGTVAVDVAAGPAPSAPTPFISIHGTADRFAPYGGGRPHGVLAKLLLRQRADPTLGVDEWAGRWLGVNGAAPEPTVDSIGPDVTLRRWRGVSPESDVAFYRIEGGGHTWPGNRSWSPPFLGRSTRSLDATTVIWDFLSSHVRPGSP